MILDGPERSLSLARLVDLLTLGSCCVPGPGVVLKTEHRGGCRVVTGSRESLVSDIECSLFPSLTGHSAGTKVHRGGPITAVHC